MTTPKNYDLNRYHLEAADRIASGITGVARHIENVLSVADDADITARHPELTGVNVAANLAIVIEAAALQLDDHIAFVQNNMGDAKCAQVNFP